jgi:hypothetical protein
MRVWLTALGGGGSLHRAFRCSFGLPTTNTTAVLGIPNAATGFNIASLLLGIPSSVNLAPYASTYQYRWKYYAGFIQDDFKITPNLTLNIGFRYQIEVPRSEKHNMQGSFVDQTVTLPTGQQQEGYIQLDGRGGAPTTLWPTRYNNWEPRIGFAYRLPSWLKGAQVLRGAYSISHIPTSGLFRIASPDLSPKIGPQARGSLSRPQRACRIQAGPPSCSRCRMRSHRAPVNRRRSMGAYTIRQLRS